MDKCKKQRNTTKKKGIEKIKEINEWKVDMYNMEEHSEREFHGLGSCSKDLAVERNEVERK